MNNRRVGVALLIISVLITGIIIQLIGSLNAEVRELGCFNNEGCIKIESSLNIMHLAFGIIGFIFALGVYLIAFTKSEEAILKRLEDEKRKRSEEEKFELILKGLDNFEKQAVKVIRGQEGITQNTLRIKTGMSKAKLSYVLTSLEKKGLVKRVKKGKTFALFSR